MTSPINTFNNMGKLASATATVPGDLASKINGVQPAGDAAAQQSDFSRWMARHTQASPQGLAAATKGDAAEKPVAAAPKPSENMDLRHASARAQANAMEANRKAQVHSTPQAHQADKPHADKPKAAGTEAAKPPQAKVKERSTSSTDARDDNKDSIDPTDQAGDVAASATAETVAGATPQDALAGEAPAASDPASMLAWLASLTQSEPTVKKTIGLDTSAKTGADDASNSALSMTAMLGTAGVSAESKGAPMALAHDQGATAAMDVSLLQATEGRFALMDPKAGMAAEQGADFAAALSAEMMRGAAVGGPGGSVQGTAAPTSETLATPLNSPEFPQALAERVGMWVKSAGEGGSLSAELHLNPAEMGPISIKISMDGQTAQVDFSAAAAETRRAIEGSLQMLSDALDEAGLRLGGSGVSDQSAQQSFGQASDQNSGRPAWMAAGQGLGDESGLAESAGNRAGAVSRDGRRAGGLDLYA
ncbi:MAG: flagellar hook-length control protein FliK [Pseudomonadota bacterium]